MFTLPTLPYSYNALAPYLDEQTMRLHHGKHHQTYADKLNSALTAWPDLAQKSIEELLADVGSLPEAIQKPVRNFGGGYANHNFFFDIIGPHRDDLLPAGKLAEAIVRDFGSFENFKKEFSDKTISIFGSGWGWLVADTADHLSVTTTANQDSPLTLGLKPLLACDVWEHAYYLKYQNRRADFVEAFFQVIDWGRVEEIFTKINN